MGHICAKQDQQKSRKKSKLITDDIDDDMMVQDIQKLARYQVSVGDFIQMHKTCLEADYTLVPNSLKHYPFGYVVQAFNKQTKMKRFIKAIQYDEKDSQQWSTINKEITIMKQLDHPNIVRLYDVYVENHKVQLVLDLCEGNSLFDGVHQIPHFKEGDAAEIMIQLLRTINYIHSIKLCHGNLNNKNLLFENQSPLSLLKITDFGYSIKRPLKSQLTKGFAISQFSAPEQVGEIGQTSSKSDIWACGVIMHFLLTGHMPFNANKDESLQKQITRCVLSYGNEWDLLSEDALDLCKQMLQFGRSKRPTAALALKHKWFKKVAQLKQPKQISSVTLGNMRNFRAKQQIQETVLMFFLLNFNNPRDNDQLRDLFVQLDRDADGRLSRDELIEGFVQQSMPREVASQEVDDILGRIDSNKSGSIDYSEFLMACVNKRRLLTGDTILNAFKLIDRDKSGKITRREMMDMFKGANLTDEQWKEMIDQVDRSGDGKISLVEFEAMMKKIIL